MRRKRLGSAGEESPGSVRGVEGGVEEVGVVVPDCGRLGELLGRSLE